MSWIAAAISDRGNEPPILPTLPGPSLHHVSMPGFAIAAGGNPDTLHASCDEHARAGWIVAGTGIAAAESGRMLMTTGDWHRSLDRSPFDPSLLDGHFIVVRWNREEIECCVDQLGLRTAFFAGDPGRLLLSTRADWVARGSGRTGTDFAALGGRWVLMNSFSADACITGVQRIGQGGRVRFRRGQAPQVSHVPWTPAFDPVTVEHATEVLQTFIQCAAGFPSLPSLGLSGGLDSRLLLALFLGLAPGRFVAHTFGDPEDPDVLVARAIAQSGKIAWRLLEGPLPPPDQLLAALHEYVAQTELTEPVSSFLRLRHYPDLRTSGHLLIDGGFGEISRRQYFNRLISFGPGALRRRDIGRLIPLVRSLRPNFFSREIIALMEEGARHGLGETLDRMPPLEQIGIETFTDLLAVRTRVPNFGSPEQARLDGQVLNYMPLVQPSFLRAAFGVPKNFRTNGRWQKSLIRNHAPGLARFPLVKSGTRHSFGRSTRAAWIAAQIGRLLGRHYVDPSAIRLLNHLREYVPDIVHSSSVRSNPAYDYPSLETATTAFYRGEHRFAPVLEWWLTYELWTRSRE